MTTCWSRRQMLKTFGSGFGMLALADLLAETSLAAPPGGPLAERTAHHPARVRSVIFLFMSGTVQLEPRSAISD